MAGVADKGAKRLALGIEKLHRRVLVQTVADALKREVHRPNTVVCESAPGLAKNSRIRYRVGHIRKNLYVPKEISP